MSKQIQKSLQDYLSRIRRIPNRSIQFQLRSCKHLRTPSLEVAAGGDKEKEGDAVTLSDVDKFLFENFRSLYDKECEEDISRKNEAKLAAILFESPRLLDAPPPENLCRSDRFFVSSGSSSSLIVEEARSSTTSATNDSSAGSEEIPATDSVAAPEDFIALLTYSPSPYDDFRRSMEEMVEARMEHNGKVDWKFLEELLFCYLELNNKKCYKFILRAFVDLIVVLRENSDRTPASRRPSNGRRGQLKSRAGV